MRYNNYHKHDHVSNIFTPDCNVHAEDYIKRCIELGHTNYFTTNHGSMGDIFEARTLCDKYGLRCIAGLEGYIVPDPLEKDKSNYHIIIIPRTNKARKKVNVISSNANINGFYYKPRIFLSDLLSLDKDDVYITTACCAGLLKDETSFNELFLPLYNHFQENIFLEVQSHIQDIQKEINKKCLALHRELGIKLIAANDSHYIDENGKYERLELLKGKGITYDDEDEFILDFPDYNTMFQRFVKQNILTEEEIKEAIDNTLIFDNCEEIALDKEIKMPTIYDNLSLKERYELLEKTVWNAFEKVKKDENLVGDELQRYIDGINYELDIVRNTNDEIHTADYFLFNTKNVDLAVNKYNGVLTRGGRGSAGSFYINRLLGMTQLDRFRINLPIFPDRFASTARLIENRSLPDIDFNVREQEPFVKASRELLGEHGCYPMYAPGTMQLSEAFRNVCRSKGIPHDSYNEVGKNIENYLDDTYWKPIIDEANKYVGTIVSGSVHPCAYLLSDKNILEEYGVIRLGEHLCVMITSMEADEYKVLKNDYLVVKVWKLISETFEMINKPILPAKDLLNNIKNDERIWDLFKKGITCTLNQVDSDNGTQQAQKFGIHSFEEGAYIAAAIRPSFDSWRKQFLDRKEYTTGSSKLDEVLSMTNGYILYQENLMQYFEWLGITPSESIGLIKKISKKKIKPEDFSKLENRIKKTWIEKTGSEDMFDETWNMIQSCMSYGFCVSGNTKLYRNGNQSGFTPTIAEMYNIRNNLSYATTTNHKALHKKYKSNGYGKALSLFDDGYIHDNAIIDIHYTGRQKTYTVTTTTGKKITCTAEHKFPTPKGELQLKELKIGDLLYVIGSYQNRNKSYRFTKEFESNVPHKGQMGFQTNPNGQSVMFMNERKRHILNHDKCEICQCEYNENFELHHISEDRTDNSTSNLQWLCNSCHKKAHYSMNRNKRFQRGLTCNTDEIISISENGFEDVYTVSMNDPAHNYAVDSGIITSNCSSHAAATSLDMCYGAYLKVNYPYEYYTVCFNNYADDQVRTNKLKEELKYFGIKLGGVKFRYSSGDYMFNKENHTIYKGIKSIKFLNEDVSLKLYSFRDRKFNSFVDLLYTLKSKTSINTRQLDILIKINFFEEFGDINKLLAITNVFEKIYTLKNISKDKMTILNIPEDMLRKHSAKETEKTFSNVDIPALLNEMCNNITYKPITVQEIIQYQAEHLGYIEYVDPKMDSRYVVVTDLDTTYSPKFKAYCIKTGQTCEMKVYKKADARKKVVTTTFGKCPFENGNILYMVACDKQPKQKKVNDKWEIVPGEYNWWLTSYQKVTNF